MTLSALSSTNVPPTPASALVGNMPNDKEVVKQLDTFHKALDMIAPVANKYNAAFPGMLDDVVNGIQKTRDSVVKAKAVLGQS